MPDSLGGKVIIRAYVDVINSGNLFNRRSHSGIVIYMNNATIIWYNVDIIYR